MTTTHFWIFILGAITGSTTTLIISYIFSHIDHKIDPYEEKWVPPVVKDQKRRVYNPAHDMERVMTGEEERSFK